MALAQRLNLLAGDNGTWAGEPILPGRSWEQGISRLSFVADVEKSETLMDIENVEGGRGIHRFAAEFQRRTQRWRPFGLDDIRGPALALYVKVDGSVAIWDVLRSSLEFYNDGADHGLVRNSSKGLTLLTHQEIWDGKRQGGDVQCARLIQDWTTWQHAKNMEFAQLTDVEERAQFEEAITLLGYGKVGTLSCYGAVSAAATQTRRY